jgi:nitrate reductase delta subunit
MDEVWAEPEAFGGCSTQGQAKPDQPQPMFILFVPPAPSGHQKESPYDRLA